MVVVVVVVAVIVIVQSNRTGHGNSNSNSISNIARIFVIRSSTAHLRPPGEVQLQLSAGDIRRALSFHVSYCESQPN